MPKILPPQGLRGSALIEAPNADADGLPSDPMLAYMRDALAEGYSWDQAWAMAHDAADTRNPNYSPALIGAGQICLLVLGSYLVGAGIAIGATSLEISSIGLRIGILGSKVWAPVYLAIRVARERDSSAYRQLTGLMRNAATKFWSRMPWRRSASSLEEAIREMPRIEQALVRKHFIDYLTKVLRGGKITREGLDAVRQHLGGTAGHPLNQAHLEELENFLEKGTALSAEARNTYFQGLLEQELMRLGFEYREAHEAAMRMLGHTP